MNNPKRFFASSLTFLIGIFFFGTSLAQIDRPNKKPIASIEPQGIFKQYNQNTFPSIYSENESSASRKIPQALVKLHLVRNTMLCKAIQNIRWHALHGFGFHTNRMKKIVLLLPKSIVDWARSNEQESSTLSEFDECSLHNALLVILEHKKDLSLVLDRPTKDKLFAKVNKYIEKINNELFIEKVRSLLIKVYADIPRIKQVLVNEDEADCFKKELLQVIYNSTMLFSPIEIDDLRRREENPVAFCESMLVGMFCAPHNTDQKLLDIFEPLSELSRILGNIRGIKDFYPETLDVKAIEKLINSIFWLQVAPIKQ